MPPNHYQKYILPNAVLLANTELNLAHRGIDQHAKLCQNESEGIFSLYRDVRIESSFQPIVDLNSQKLIGFEATARAKKIGGHAIPYASLIQRPESPLEHIYLDRLLRIQHTLNYIVQAAHHNARLFLNVSTILLTGIASEHGHFFKMLAQSCGVKSGEVVLEISLPNTVSEQDVKALESYRSNGFAIAIDQITPEHPIADLIRAIKPDIVKVNSLAFKGADATERLRELVDIAKTAGVIVVGTHIEKPVAFKQAVSTGIDWGQGFYIASPNTEAIFKPAWRQDVIETCV